MRAIAGVVALALFVAVSAQGSPLCHQQFAMIYSQNYPMASNCSYFHVVPGTGGIEAPVSNVPPCGDVGTSNTGNARSAYSASTRLFYFVTGRGKSVWSADIIKGAFTATASLPASYNYTLGLVFDSSVGSNGGSLFVVTQDMIFAVANGGSTVATYLSIASLGLSEDAVVTGDNAGNLYVADGTSFWRVSLASKTISAELKVQSAQQIQDIQYYGNSSSLLVVDSGQLLVVAPGTGASKPVLRLSGGTADYGRVNSVDGVFWYYADRSSNTIFKINVATNPATQVATTPWDPTPVLGYIQYFV